MTTVDQDFLSNHHRAFMPCIAYVLQHILALVTFDPFLRPKTVYSIALPLLRVRRIRASYERYPVGENFGKYLTPTALYGLIGLKEKL